MIKVSIIVPVYNAEKYLSQCMESVMNQTLEDIEIICIDDGSTDASWHIIKNLSDKINKGIKTISDKTGKQKSKPE